MKKLVTSKHRNKGLECIYYLHQSLSLMGSFLFILGGIIQEI